MILNNIVIGLFIIYMVLLPLFVSFDHKMHSSHILTMICFDIIFFIDRSLDLFVGYYREDGQMENRPLQVIRNNLSIKYFFEIIMSFGTFFLDVNNMDSVHFAIFKIPRWIRLFEME